MKRIKINPVDTVVFIILGLMVIWIAMNLVRWVGEGIRVAEDPILYAYSQKYKIYSADLTSEIKGEFYSSFIIGEGHISEDTYYYVMTETPDGGAELKKYNTKGTHIFWDEETSPYIVKRIESRKFHYSDNTIVDIIFKRFCPSQIALSDGYDLHVPKNTIVKDFKASIQ